MRRHLAPSSPTFLFHSLDMSDGEQEDVWLLASGSLSTRNTCFAGCCSCCTRMGEHFRVNDRQTQHDERLLLLDDDYVPYREAAPAHSLSRPIRAAIGSAASSTRFDLRYNEI